VVTDPDRTIICRRITLLRRGLDVDRAELLLANVDGATQAFSSPSTVICPALRRLMR